MLPSLGDLASPHFYFRELVKSDIAIRKGIDNTPTDPQIYTNLSSLAHNIFEPVRAQFGAFSPNSVYRCEKLEYATCEDAFKRWCNQRSYQAGMQAFGTAAWKEYFANKQHPLGCSGDIELPGDKPSNYELASWIESNLDFDQVILEFYDRKDPNSGWVHVSYRKTGNRKQALTISSNGRTSLGLLK